LDDEYQKILAYESKMKQKLGQINKKLTGQRKETVLKEGQENVPDAPAEKPVPKTLSCPYCGAENRQGMKFCNSCGKPLGKQE